MRYMAILAATALALPSGPPANASGPSPVGDWLPDYRFDGEDIDHWETVGDIDWDIDGSVIIARPRSAKASGFLLLPMRLQDVAAAADFHCQTICDVGLLFRVERTDGNIIVAGLARSTAEGASLSAAMFDKGGALSSQSPLRPTNVQSRFAVPEGGNPAGAAPSVPGIDNPLRPLYPRTPAPILNPKSDLNSLTSSTPGGERVSATEGPATQSRPQLMEQSAQQPARPPNWRRMQLLVDTNIARAWLDYAPAMTGVTMDDASGYGPIGLYVGPGSGEVHFKTLVYRDLGAQVVPQEYTSPAYEARRLDDFSYAWDAAVADIDQDGHLDIIAGPYWYRGPDFRERRELYIASTYSPGNQYAANMITHAGDFDGDSWPDVLITEGRQMALLVNPRGERRRWDRHLVVPGNISEITILDDLDGDGHPELLIVQSGRAAFAQPDMSDPTAPWPVFYISPVPAKLHGFGVGDISGDGRKDILQPHGWWEQPTAGIMSAEWTFHPFQFGNPEAPHELPEGGGNMLVVDVDGDGLNDVITSINAHGWGLAWYRQIRVGNMISFEPHLIMGDHSRHNPGNLTISQLHAGVVAGRSAEEGGISFFTGKKRWAHLDSHADPDPSGNAYIVRYQSSPDPAAPGGVRFTPEIIHNRSGVGSGLTVIDINRNGQDDIVTSGVNGTFVFLSRDDKGGSDAAK